MKDTHLHHVVKNIIQDRSTLTQVINDAGEKEQFCGLPRSHRARDKLQPELQSQCLLMACKNLPTFAGPNAPTLGVGHPPEKVTEILTCYLQHWETASSIFIGPLLSDNVVGGERKNIPYVSNDYWSCHCW
jgi:hypothetical protein